MKRLFILQVKNQELFTNIDLFDIIKTENQSESESTYLNQSYQEDSIWT